MRKILDHKRQKAKTWKGNKKLKKIPNHKSTNQKFGKVMMLLLRFFLVPYPIYMIQLIQLSRLASFITIKACKLYNYRACKFYRSNKHKKKDILSNKNAYSFITWKEWHLDKQSRYISFLVFDIIIYNCVHSMNEARWEGSMVMHTQYKDFWRV